jgi:hypothetical protein
MSYPAGYGGAPPLPFIIAANNDSDDENECAQVGYNRDAVENKLPAK